MDPEQLPRPVHAFRPVAFGPVAFGPVAFGPVAFALSFGLFGGLVLGVVARAWMRFIAKDPEFSWSGTLMIVFGFGLFGITHAGGFVTRRVATKPVALTLARVVSTIGTLPLFVAAGAQMFPTVVFGGLALARGDWAPWIRVGLFALASAPIVFVGNQFVRDFGWSDRTAGGMLGLLIIYGAIVRVVLI